MSTPEFRAPRFRTKRDEQLAKRLGLGVEDYFTLTLVASNGYGVPLSFFTPEAQRRVISLGQKGLVEIDMGAEAGMESWVRAVEDIRKLKLGTR